MSLYTALLAGTTGLRAYASAMAATSDNIANTNTVGYKRMRTDFEALLVGQSEFTTYNAGGVLANQSQEVRAQGALGVSQNPTHLAIAGDGLFVVRPKSDDATVADPYLFSRAGQFSPDADGYLVNTAGHFLYGWPANEDGTISTSPSDLTTLEPVRIGGLIGTAEATENVSFTANLDARQEISVAAATYDLAAAPAVSMASGAVTPDYQTTVQVFDSLGGPRTLALSYLKSQTPNEWFVEAHIVPATDLQATGLPDGRVASGVVAFQSNGLLDAANTTFPSTLSFGESATPVAGPVAAWAAAEGLEAQTIELEFDQTNGGLTQYSSPSELTQTSQDGLAFGVPASIQVNEEGLINALYTNGVVETIYQIPLAKFPNYSGLSPEAGGAFGLTVDTGDFILGTANRGGTGSIRSQSLEASTVDLAEEFSNMILTQRSYSASSRIVTTADEMLDELIRLA